MGILRLAGRHLAGGFNVDTTRQRLASIKDTARDISFFFSVRPENELRDQDIDGIEKKEYAIRFRNLRLVAAAALIAALLLCYSAVTAEAAASTYLSIACAALSTLYYFACCRLMFQARAVYLDWANRASETRFKVTWLTFFKAASKRPVLLLPIKIQE